MSRKGFLRLPVVLLVLGATFQACGGLNSVDVIITDDEGEAGSNGSSAGNNSGEGGADSTAGGSTGSTNAGAGGVDTMLPIGGGSGVDCTEGEPCDSGAQPGICVDGSCAGCEDEADDAACVTSYGEGYLCIDATCVQAECRGDDGCALGACVDHQCQVCAADADCVAADTICNTATGACVSNQQCAAITPGAVCPVNDQDLCCGPGNACTAVACCGTNPCKVDAGSATNDGQCHDGQCVRPSCLTPAGTTRYVDFDEPSGGSGSKACPFNNIKAAFDALAATGGTVAIRAGAATTIDSPLAMGSGIALVGADANLDPCTKATCPANDYPVITTGNRRALNLLTAGNRTLRYLRFIGLPNNMKDDADWAGVYVTAATLTIDHVELSGYQSGLYADTGGSVSVGPGMDVHHNRTGLFVADGNGAVGGTVSITVAAGADPSHFDNNNTGIACHGNGLLTIAGPPANRQTPGLITANDNGGSGLYYPSSNPDGEIIGFEAAGNGASATASQHDGATIFAHAMVRVRDSYFHDNLGSGVHVPPNGMNTPQGLEGINLGGNAGNSAGKNTFIANALAGICVEAGPANNADPDSFRVAGNYFRTSGGDCTAGGTYTRAKNCEGGVDYSGNCAGAADFTSCTPSNACE